MYPSQLGEIAQDALILLLLLSVPVLAGALLSGVIAGLLAAYTKLSDPAVGMAARSIAVIGGLLLVLPWMATRVGDFARETWSMIAQIVH